MNAELFNELYAIGTPCIWLPTKQPGDQPMRGHPTHTRSDAWELGGHAVVLINHRPGGVAISHLVFSKGGS